MVWALRGTTYADVVVPAEFVSICNNKGPFGLVTVTDRDGSRGGADCPQRAWVIGRTSVENLPPNE